MLDRRSPLDPGPAPADASAATRLGEEQDLDLRAGRPDDFFSVIVNSSVSESRTRGPPESAGRIRAQLDSRNRTPSARFGQCNRMERAGGGTNARRPSPEPRARRTAVQWSPWAGRA